MPTSPLRFAPAVGPLATLLLLFAPPNLRSQDLSAPEFACGTSATQAPVKDAGSYESSGPTECESGHCKTAVRYRTQDGETLDMVAFSGTYTSWLAAPQHAALLEPVVDLLLRNSDAQYRYYANLLGREPAPTGPALSIALVPCARNRCKREGGGGGVFGRALLGRKSTEMYFGPELESTIESRINSFALLARRMGRDEYLVAHEMAHNFDIGGSARLGRADEAMHAWTALLAAQIVQDWTPTLGKTSFIEYDLTLSDYANAAAVARRYADTILAPNAGNVNSNLKGCIDAGDCNWLSANAGAVLAGLVLRADAVAREPLLRRWLQRSMSNGTPLNSASLVTELSDLGATNFSCAADAMHLGLSESARASLQARFGAPTHCGDTDGDGLADFVDTRADPAAMPWTSLPRGADGHALATSLPLRVEGTLDGSANPILDVALVAGEAPLLFRSCARSGRFEVRHDLTVGPPERPDYTIRTTDAERPCAEGQLLPYPGQEKAQLQLIGPGNFELSLWRAPPEPREDGPFALAHLVDTPQGPEVDWRLLDPTRLPPDWNGIALHEGRLPTVLSPNAASTRLPLAMPNQRGLLQLTAQRGDEPVAATLIPTVVVSESTALQDPEAGLAGIWYDPAATGWGLQLELGKVGTERLLLAAIYSFRGNSRTKDPLGGQSWLFGVAPFAPGAARVPILPMEHGSSSPLRAAGQQRKTSPWGQLVLQPDGDQLVAHFFGHSGYRGLKTLSRLTRSVATPWSGVWHDPQHSGMGWTLSVSNGSLVAAWYRYRDDDHRQQWLAGSGSVVAPDQTAEIEVQGGQGGHFADRHTHGLSTQTPWGRLRFRLLACGQLEITTLPAEGASQRFVAQRLLHPMESSCEL